MKISSPCIKVCKLNHNDYCIACKRSSLEIFEWISYSEEKRKDVMKELVKRKI